LYDFKGFLSKDKGYDRAFSDSQDIAMQRPNDLTSAEKRHAQLMRGDKYDKALYCLWDLPQSKSMNVRYTARYSPQPSS